MDIKLQDRTSLISQKYHPGKEKIHLIFLGLQTLSVHGKKGYNPLISKIKNNNHGQKSHWGILTHSTNSITKNPDLK
jgi:hypothetical protein